MLRTCEPHLFQYTVGTPERTPKPRIRIAHGPIESRPRLGPGGSAVPARRVPVRGCPRHTDLRGEEREPEAARERVLLRRGAGGRANGDDGPARARRADSAHGNRSRGTCSRRQSGSRDSVRRSTGPSRTDLVAGTSKSTGETRFRGCESSGRDGGRGRSISVLSGVGAYPAEAVRLVEKVFRLRSCPGSIRPDTSSFPCLQHGIDLCTAPCVGLVGVDAYRKQVRAAVRVLAQSEAAVEAVRRCQELRDASLVARRSRSDRLGAATDVAVRTGRLPDGPGASAGRPLVAHRATGCRAGHRRPASNGAGPRTREAAGPLEGHELGGMRRARVLRRSDRGASSGKRVRAGGIDTQPHRHGLAGQTRAGRGPGRSISTAWIRVPSSVRCVRRPRHGKPRPPENLSAICVRCPRSVRCFDGLCIPSPAPSCIPPCIPCMEESTSRCAGVRASKVRTWAFRCPARS